MLNSFPEKQHLSIKLMYVTNQFSKIKKLKLNKQILKNKKKLSEKKAFISERLGGYTLIETPCQIVFLFFLIKN